MKFGKEYKAFAIINLAYNFAGIAVPYFASSLNTTRLYQITLFFLAPFFVIGGIATFNRINKLLGVRLVKDSMKMSFKLLSLFLAISLLFNSGFIYEVANDTPISISLDKTMDYPRFNDKEVYAAQWVSDTIDSNPIYADYYGVLLFKEFEYERVKYFFSETQELSSESYIYFRNINLKSLMLEKNKKRIHIYVELLDSIFYNQVITKKNMIYDNGGSEIFKW